MKRFLKLAFVLVFTLSILCSLTIAATAAELKTAIGIVNAAGGLRLRSEPSTTASTIAVAAKNDSVVIIEKVGKWYKVNYNLYTGYMHSDYLTVKERENVNLGRGLIDAGVVNMRSEPSTAGALVDQLRSGEKVQIFGFNSSWYKVRFDGKVGYIRSDLVALLEKPAANSGTAKGPGSSSVNSSSGQKIATYAQQYVGYPYIYGGSSPSGFDCSGFVQYVYKQNGYSINRTATAQLKNGTWVSYDDMQPGDIVYFGYGNTASHVGIYIGDGKFVHAQNSSTGVVISSLSESWYANRYLCVHRIVN